MKVSVLTITLNEEHYISKLLDSLTRQTHKDFEVILVDGNSKDKTCEVAQKYTDKLDLHIHRLDSNGIAMQRNVVAAKSTTDHCFFVDADTILEPQFIEKVVTTIEQERPDIIGVWNDPDSDNLVDRFYYDVFNIFMFCMQKIDPVAVGAFTYANKNTFNKMGGYDENIAMAEDLDLARRMHKLGYKYVLLTDPKIRFSVRRLVKMGRVNFALYMLKNGATYFLKKQNLTKDKYQYDIGNHLKI